WSPRFLKRKKRLQCHRAAWAAWTIDAEVNSAETPKNFGANRQPKQQLTNSRTRKGPAALLWFSSESRKPGGVDSVKNFPHQINQLPRAHRWSARFCEVDRFWRERW